MNDSEVKKAVDSLSSTIDVERVRGVVEGIIEIQKKESEVYHKELRKRADELDAAQKNIPNPVTLIAKKYSFTVQTKEEILEQWKTASSAENK